MNVVVTQDASRNRTAGQDDSGFAPLESQAGSRNHAYGNRARLERNARDDAMLAGMESDLAASEARDRESPPAERRRAAHHSRRARGEQRDSQADAAYYDREDWVAQEGGSYFVYRGASASPLATPEELGQRPNGATAGATAGANPTTERAPTRAEDGATARPTR